MRRNAYTRKRRLVCNKDHYLRNRIVNSSAKTGPQTGDQGDCEMIQILRMVRRTLGTIRRRNVYAMAVLASTCAYAQMFTFSRQELIDYTAKSPFDRLADGRPKVSDAMIERARDLSSEEVWAGLQEEGFKNQYADGFQVL